MSKQTTGREITKGEGNRRRHTKYYLVVEGDEAIYTKAESDLIFSDKEGMGFIKSRHPKATSITKIPNKKAKSILGLANIINSK